MLGTSQKIGTAHVCLLLICCLIRFNLLFIFIYFFLNFLPLALFTISTLASLPTPPKQPEKFASEQEIREYLHKIKEYYEILGERPRWGRRSMPIDTINELDLNLDQRENGSKSWKNLQNILGLNTNNDDA